MPLNKVRYPDYLNFQHNIYAQKFRQQFSACKLGPGSSIGAHA